MHLIKPRPAQQSRSSLNRNQTREKRESSAKLTGKVFMRNISELINHCWWEVPHYSVIWPSVDWVILQQIVALVSWPAISPLLTELYWRDWRDGEMARCYKCDVYCTLNSSSSPRKLRLNWVTNNGILNEFAGPCNGGPETSGRGGGGCWDEMLGIILMSRVESWGLRAPSYCQQSLT